jgi:hypothetical protein
MTSREKKLKSMLNYYGIDMTPTKDESLTKRDLQKFLKRINDSYDSQMAQDIFKKIRDKLTDQINPKDDEESDPFFDSLREQGKDGSKDDNMDSLFPPDLNALSGRGLGEDDGLGKRPLGINPEIEMFLEWLTDTLYSADHKVVVRESEDGLTTHIELQKITGKKKRGGRKK